MRKIILFLGLLLASMSATPLQSQGANDVELKGDYAFSFTGMTSGGSGASTPFAAVGRFTADGAGNLSKGELDSNGLGVSLGGVEKAVALAFTGTYSIDADHRGLMNLNIPGGGTLAFVMLANGSAKFVEVDASGGHGTVGSGTMEKADITAYSTAKIVGDYAFGAAGLDQSNNRVAIAGRVSASGTGIFSNGAADVNQAGRFTTLNAFAETYQVTDTTSGRGVLMLPPAIGGALQNLNFVFYIVNAGKLFAMETDAVTTATPLLNGAWQQQQTPLGGFSNASLNGGMVAYLTGRAASGCGGAPAPNVIAGLFSTNGSGQLTLTYDQNCGGVPTSETGLTGSYNTAGNGRTDIHAGTSYLVAYLLHSNQALLLAPDSSVLFGFGEPQAATLFSNSSMGGAYSGFASNPATLGVKIFSGEFIADGAGNVTGTEDIGATSGATLGAAVSAAYSISSTPTNGRGTVSGNVAGNAVAYIISTSKFVVVSMSDANPAALIFEQ